MTPPRLDPWWQLRSVHGWPAWWSRGIIGLLVLLLRIVPDAGATERGMARWFSCGIGFWGPCVPPSDPVPVAPVRDAEGDHAESLAPEALRNWGTPVVGPSGALSYQLPPRPLLDLFYEPTDAHAREYLQWLSEKTRHREAAFAAIKRMAAEVGYSVGQRPANGSAGTGVPPEMLRAGLLPDGGMGPMPDVTALAGTGMPVPQPTLNAPLTTPALTVPPAVSSRVSGPAQAIGPQTRVLYFFAPHCPYCAQETPLLNALLRGRTDVVGIAMDTTPDALMTYLRTTRLAFPVTLDRGESHAFGITGYPAVVVRDATGAARKLTGLATTDQLQRLLQGATP